MYFFLKLKKKSILLRVIVKKRLVTYIGRWLYFFKLSLKSNSDDVCEVGEREPYHIDVFSSANTNLCAAIKMIVKLTTVNFP